MFGRTGPQPVRWGRGRLSEQSAIVTPKPNFLLNSGMRVWQQGTAITDVSTGTSPVNNDVTYTADQWILLSDGNDIVDVSEDKDERPANAWAAMEFLVVTSSKKFGICQILEERDTQALFSDASGSCTLSFYAKTISGQVENLRATVTAWDSTADSPASGAAIVGAWSVEGTDPTDGTNWTKEVAGSDLVLTNSFQRFTIENIKLDTASTGNVAVFIWVDDTDLIGGDRFWITNVKLETGARVTDYQHIPLSQDFDNCRRFFEQFTYDEVSGQVIVEARGGTTNQLAEILFAYNEKRTTPVITNSDVTSFDSIGTLAAGAAGVADALTWSNQSRYNATCTFDSSATPFTSDQNVYIIRDGTDTCFIRVDARL